MVIPLPILWAIKTIMKSICSSEANRLLSVACVCVCARVCTRTCVHAHGMSIPARRACGGDRGEATAGCAFSADTQSSHAPRPRFWGRALVCFGSYLRISLGCCFHIGLETGSECFGASQVQTRNRKASSQVRRRLVGRGGLRRVLGWGWYHPALWGLYSVGPSGPG